MRLEVHFNDLLYQNGMIIKRYIKVWLLAGESMKGQFVLFMQNIDSVTCIYQAVLKKVFNLSCFSPMERQPFDAFGWRNRRLLVYREGYVAPWRTITNVKSPNVQKPKCPNTILQFGLNLLKDVWWRITLEFTFLEWQLC